MKNKVGKRGKGMTADRHKTHAVAEDFEMRGHARGSANACRKCHASSSRANIVEWYFVQGNYFIGHLLTTVR